MTNERDRILKYLANALADEIYRRRQLEEIQCLRDEHGSYDWYHMDVVIPAHRLTGSIATLRGLIEYLTPREEYTS